MATEVIPVIYRQIGWKPCVACSDAHRMHFGGKKGQMWLGLKPNGLDDWVDCPECKGEGRMPRLQVLDARTGEEIKTEEFYRDRKGDVIPDTTFQLIPVQAPMVG